MTSYLVGVHGILNYPYFRRAGSAAAAAASISAEWTSWLGSTPITVGYYAHHLHRGTAQGADDIDTLDDFATALLVDWLEQARPGRQIAEGDRTARARALADWVTRKHGALARAFVTAFVREASVYLKEPGGRRRQAAREEVAAAIATATAAHDHVTVVAHSLGSVVAYEALWSHPELRVDTLLTLGSPLAMRNVVFERLRPKPQNRGGRPPNVGRWINLADVGDLVALPRTGLAAGFDGVDTEVTDLRIDDWDFHTVRNYLRCPDVLRHLAR